MGEPLRVLIVEDSEDDALLLVRELGRSEYEVSWKRVETAEEMRSALDSKAWDLVISDFSMPHFSGPAALRVLAETGFDLPFIIVSGTVGEDVAVEAMKAGAHDYLRKGSLMRLLPAVQRELEQAAQRHARREAEEQYRLLLESTAQAVYGLDLEGRCTFSNPACRQLLGYGGPEDLLGKNIHRLAHHTRPDGSPYPVNECRIHQAIYRGEGVHVDDEVLWRADGSRLFAEYWSYPVWRGGEVVGGVVAFLDITERRHAEESIRKLSLAVEQAENIIFMTEPNGTITYVNPAFEKVYGFSKEEALGQTPRILKSGRYDDAYYDQFWQRLLSGESVRGEMTNKKRDGQFVTVEESVTPVHDSGGRRIGFIAVQDDITERKILEEQVRQSQKMEAIGQLAGGVAHDFNNLLTAILGYSDLLTGRVEGSDLQEAVAEIKKAGERAAALTRQLLAFSRKQVLNPEVLDANQLIENLEKMLRRLIGENIDLAVRLSPNLGRVRADAGQIEQVILNLAVNARDAMPGGGKLVIETADIELDDAYAREHVAVHSGPYVMIAVSDSGVGMTAETRARIFEPFFTTKKTGTGLGLATVYGIVKQSGGNIWVYSEPGRGTTMKVYLPRLEGQAQEPRPKAADAVLAGGSETILLVEDEASVRALVRRILERFGYSVLAAGSGAEALEIAGRQSKPIDLLVTDLIMPGMAGPDLAAKLTASRPEMRVLFMSGYTDDAVIRDGLLPEKGLFLQKPFTPDGLARKVREALS